MLASASYKPFARLLHWIVAILVIATIPAGQIMIREGLERGTQDALFIFHKNIGVVILLLVIMRLVYRVFNPAPPLPASIPPLQRHIAQINHWLLYALLIVMGVSGYVRVSAGGFPLEVFDAMGIPKLVGKSDPIAAVAQSIHFYTRIALIPLILIHIGAALYHAVLKRDGVFSRMAPWPTGR